METKIYSTENCPRCGALKTALNLAGYTYQDADMTTSESRAALLTGNCFSLSAPVLQIGEDFYGPDQLFDVNGNLLHDKLLLILDGQVPKWKAFAGIGGKASEKVQSCDHIWGQK